MVERRAFRSKFAFVLLALLFLAAAVFLARDVWLTALGEALIHDDGAGKAEIAVVLAGDNWGYRLTKAAELAKQGYVPRVLLTYPGDLDSCNSLLRHLRRLSRDALIDGIPYRQYWGEVLAPGGDRKQQSPLPRYRILRPEDEAEVERLYQRLKTVGNLDQKNSTDEK